MSPQRVKTRFFVGTFLCNENHEGRYLLILNSEIRLILVFIFQRSIKGLEKYRHREVRMDEIQN